MRKRKVLHIAYRYYPYIGGSTLRLSQILENLDKDEYDISLLTVENATLSDLYIDKYEIINGIKVYRIDGFFKRILTIRKFIKLGNFDIIHVHNPRLAMLVNIIGFKNPIIAEVHSINETSLVKKQLIKYALKKVDRLIVLSQSGIDITSKYYGIKKEKILALPNGINIDRFSKALELENKTKNQLNIGYIGTMYEWQGVKEIVKSAKDVINECDNVKYILVGSGPLLDELKRMTQDFKIENYFRFYGAVDSRMIPELMNSIDIFIMARPSTIATETVVPLKIFEAMAAQKTIIISNVGGLTEVLKPGSECICINPGSTIELTEAIIDLYNNPNKRVLIAKNAYEKVVSYPSWSKVADTLNNIYLSM